MSHRDWATPTNQQMHPDSAAAWRSRPHDHVWEGGGHDPEMCKFCWRSRTDVTMAEGGWVNGPTKPDNLDADMARLGIRGGE